MRRLTLLLSAFLVLAAGSCSAKTSHPGARPGTPTTSHVTTTGTSPFPVGETQAQIVHDIRTKGLTSERALMLFSIQVGPLPGVPKHTGNVDKTDFDGSMATSYLYEVWSRLTTAQRKAAAGLLGRPTTGPPPTTAAFRGGTTPAPHPIALRESPAYDYLHLAESASVAEAAGLGQKPISKFRIDVSYDLPGTAYAATSWYYKPWYATAYQPFGDGCHITVWDQKMQAVPGPDAAAVMAHEVFHCYQQIAAGSGEAVATIGSWVEEGEATWVMAQVVPLGSGVVENKWSKYTFTPTTTYVDRSYDALGVFGHYGDVVHDQSAVWPRLLPTVVADVGGHDSDALGVLIAGSETDFYQQWGASYFEDSADPSWKMSGPGTPPAAGPTPEHLSIGSGQSHALPFAGPAQVSQAVIQSDADVLIVYLMDGYGRLHDEGHGVDSPLDQTGPIALCLRSGGCACPDGSPGASEHTTKAKGPISVGLEGGNHTAQAGGAGKSLDEFCKKPDKPPTPPGGGGGSGGGGGGADTSDTPPGPTSGGRTTGDPHLTTFDGLRYDFQTVGEFTLARSTTDGFLVQVRQVAANGSQFASVNTAMATRLGGKRLEIGLAGGRTVLRLDGAVAATLPGRVGGTTISRTSTMFGDSYTLTWHDGTVVRVVPIGVLGLNVEISPAAGRKGKLAGLLGDFDGKPANDLSTGSGAPLGTSPATEAVDHALADHWRITQAASLFTYPAGRTTTSYTDRRFPYTTAIANRADAERVCRDAGITDDALLQACVVDTAATNAPLFASMYGFGQAVSTARAGKASGGSTATVDRTVTLAGTLSGSKTSVEVPLKVSAGDVTWIVWGSGCSDDNGNVSMQVLAPDGTALGPTQPACQYGRAAFSKTATYTVHLFVGAGEHSSYSVPVQFQRHDVVADAAYGQTISGTIPQPAAHDVYRFKGTKGDQVHLWGPGCSLDTVQVVIYDPQGNGNPGYGCRKDTPLTLTESGTWSLVVNDGNQGPGSYAFVLQR